MKVAPAVDAWDNKFSAHPKSANGCKWVLWNPRIQPYHGTITMGYSHESKPPKTPVNQTKGAREVPDGELRPVSAVCSGELAPWQNVPGKTVDFLD